MTIASETTIDHAVKTSGMQISETDVAIDVIGMHKWYGDFHVLRDINLRVMRGERIVEPVGRQVRPHHVDRVAGKRQRVGVRGEPDRLRGRQRLRATHAQALEEAPREVFLALSRWRW